MLYVVTGGSGSGKSEYAENLAVQLSGGQYLYYVAAMQPYGEEARERIRRHRALRDGKGFQTIECYREIGQLPDRIGPAACTKATILLECMSNLLANELFGDGKPLRDDEPFLQKRLLAEVSGLSRQCRHLIIVTNEVFSDGVCYDQETEQYREMLGKMNRGLVKQADEAAEIVYTIPVRIKKRKREAYDL